MQEQVNSAMVSAKEAAATVGERVSDFFQGNPFTTRVGQKIEMATDASALATENWGLNMEICDFINSTEEGGRDAIRAIRKRLHTQMSRNNAVVMYTLTVLETCVKNCDTRFHELVCQKEFINELVRLIGPKFDAPQIIQERVLSLIQSWNDAFRGDARLQGVCQVYDELKAKGVEFPMTDLDAMAPILTPKKTIFPASSHEASRDTVHPSASAIVAQNFVDPSQPVQPTSEQLEKLRGELDLVNRNLQVFREMLSELVPGKEQSDEVQLLRELHSTCKAMQLRILDLIRQILNEQVTYELLVLNDELNNVFEKYDRYVANRSSGSAATTGESNLIQIDERDLSKQLEALETHDASSTKSKSAADIYAENSKKLDQADVGLATAAFNKTVPIDEREVKEMSDWLAAQDPKGTSEATTSVPTEFDPLIAKSKETKKDPNDAL